MSLIRNPYFQTKTEPGETITLSTNEIKTYSEGEGLPVPENAPKVEPVKGFSSIIIPAYLNSYPIFHKTGDCIGAIREHTNKDKTPYEIILVLNGKGIKFDHLEATHADKVIEDENPLGFSKAVNKGIRVAKGEYIAVVSNDVLVFNRWLEDMQEALQYKDLIMATPMYGMPYARAIEANEFRQKTMDKSIQDTFSNFRDFSCILTKKKLFDEVGLLNEEFHMYSEDVDFLRRLEKAGKTFVSTKRVNTTHIIGMTSSGIPETPKIMDASKEKLRQIWGE